MNWKGVAVEVGVCYWKILFACLLIMVGLRQGTLTLLSSFQHHPLPSDFLVGLLNSARFGLF